MKFSIPFFGKRTSAGTPADTAHNQESTQTSADPLAPPPSLGEKKPFVVPPSAEQMPAFTEAVDPAALNPQREAVAEKVLDEVEQPQQMQSMLMSAEDVIAAYKIFLKRHPENLEVIKPRVGLTSDRMLVDFLSSREFLARPEIPNLIIALAKKIIEEQQAAKANATSAPTQPSAAGSGTQSASEPASSGSTPAQTT